MNFPTNFLFLYVNGHWKVSSLPLHGSQFKDIFFQLCQIQRRRTKTTFPNWFLAGQLMNLPLDSESYLKKNFLSYDLNGIFFMFYKHNWNILNKSQVYSSPKMFFLSLATCEGKRIIRGDVNQVGPSGVGLSISPQVNLSHVQCPCSFAYCSFSESIPQITRSRTFHLKNSYMKTRNLLIPLTKTKKMLIWRVKSGCSERIS